MKFTRPTLTRALTQRANPSATFRDESPLFDEATIAGFRRLVLLSRQTVAEGLAGEHRSRRRGSSPEFADFKMYSQGDDFRRVDWNLYARLDEVIVRLSEVTTELTVHVLLDCSTSMNWRSSDALPTKYRYARQLAGALSYVSLWHFDRVVISPFGRQLGQGFGPSQGRAYTVPMLKYLSDLQPMGETDLPAAIEQYVQARRRPGILLLISDLLSGEPEQLAVRLRDLRARRWQTIVVHVVDPAELSPGGEEGEGWAEPAELTDLETGEKLRINQDREVIQRYESAVAEWCELIKSACVAEHADYLRLDTSWPLQSLVLSLLYRRGLLA
jgi:uncharacterized protein (DUF58 family)